MREMNLIHTWPWAGNPNKFRKAWKHIWSIFENEGTNEYATWVFNPYVGQTIRHGTGNRYYPGDQYVDWIGFNGYNWDGQGSWSSRSSLKYLFSYPSKVYHNKHSTKPQMICETGMDNLRYKPRWVASGLGSMKSQLPGIKGVSFWSMNWSHSRINNFDSRIDSSPEALKAYKSVVQDPYFLGKIPYRKFNR